MPDIFIKLVRGQDAGSVQLYRRLTLIVLLASLPITALAVMSAPDAATPLALLALGLLTVLGWRWYRWIYGGSWHWADVALDAAVIVAASQVVGYPAPLLTMIYLSMFYRPLIGPSRFANVAALGAVLAFVTAAFLTRNNPDAMSWATVLSQVPLMLVSCAIGVLLGNTLTRQADLNAELAKAEARYRLLVEQLPEVVFTCNPDGLVTYVSPQAFEIFDWTPESVKGMTLDDILSRVHPDDVETFKTTSSRALAGNRPFMVEHRYETPTRGWVWLQVRGQMIPGPEPGQGQVLGTLTDITERKELEQRMAFQAYHDNLTGLPNRTLFRDRLQHALDRSARSDSLLAVLFLDLDNFKLVNDSLGHQAGDELIRATAERLQAIMRAGDTIGRIGGDEFLLLLEGLASEHDGTQAAERIFEALAADLELRGRELAVSASIGIAFASGHGVDADDLIRHADVAMYAAKRAGRGRYSVYRQEMGAKIQARLDIEMGLRRALQLNELAVHYQPVIDLRTGRIAGVEALARWNHPERGLLMPGEFIEVAEETGLIRELDLWIMRAACRQVRAWQTALPAHAELVASVNLSAALLREPRLSEHVAEILRDTGLDPRHLKLEITEHAMIADIQMARQALTRLHKLGVRLAIDDFGTGNSALTYLRDFPVSTLKIDRSFVTGLRQGTGDPEMVAALITLAQSLGLDVTAEGIEYDEYVELRRFGCDHGQGYSFSRPQAAASIEAMLRSPALELGATAAYDDIAAA